MTSYKVMLVLCLCAVSLSSATKANGLEEGSIQERSAVIYEGAAACMRTGGLCTRAEHCPLADRGGDGLCLGGEDLACCMALPTVLQSCQERGGECVPRGDCAGRLAPTLDVECGAGMTCCVHV